jgi:hypothetical protein
VVVVVVAVFVVSVVAVDVPRSVTVVVTAEDVVEVTLEDETPIGQGLPSSVTDELTTWGLERTGPVTTGSPTTVVGVSGLGSGFLKRLQIFVSLSFGFVTTGSPTIVEMTGAPLAVVIAGEPA